MIVVAALWIAVLLLVGGFALDRVLTASIVQQFRRPARICPERDDRLVRDRPRRRGPLQPPAGRPALPRALFGRLFPDQRRGRRHLPVALAVGPAAARRRRATTTSTSTSTTATNSPASRCASSSATSILPGSQVRWRFQVAAVARDARRRRSASCARPCLRASPSLGARPARPGRAADLLRPVAAAPGAARESPRSARARRPAIDRATSRREIQPLTEEINAAARP